jgi:hypothetical protein
MRQATLFLITLFLAAGLATAQEVPKRKSGLWEITRTSTRTDDKPRVTQMCVDEATDNALRQVAEGMRSETCQTDKISRDGDKLVVDSTCSLRRGSSTSKTRAVITGKFDSAYKIESKSTYEPPLVGQKEGRAVLEAKWTGACKADQRPGDVMLPNGQTVNISEEAHAPADKSAAHSKDKAQAHAKDLTRAPARKPGFMPVPTR